MFPRSAPRIFLLALLTVGLCLLAGNPRSKIPVAGSPAAGSPAAGSPAAGSPAATQSDKTHGSAWAQWRGPNRNGAINESVWPASLANLSSQWRVDLGPSYSGPIVADGKVFVTETLTESTEVVRAFDRHTGSELWRTQWQGAIKVPFFAAKNGSWIRATPAFDEGALYVAGMEDVLVCLDATNGDILWQVDFKSRYNAPQPDFGYVSSPLVDGDFVYTQAGASLVKLNKHTGAEVWRTLKDGGGMMGSAFSSPVFHQIDGQRQLIVQTRSHLCGVEPATGAVLWQREVPSFRGMNILTPTFHGERIFTSTARNKSFYYAVNTDEKQVDLLWDHKAAAYMSSPIIIDDYAYLHLQNNRIACLNLATGEEVWRTSQRFGDYWSMIANGDRILALDADGELFLLDATPQAFQLLDQRAVANSSTWAYLAKSGEDLFVRALDSLQVYRWTETPQPTSRQ